MSARLMPVVLLVLGSVAALQAAAAKDLVLLQGQAPPPESPAPEKPETTPDPQLPPFEYFPESRQRRPLFPPAPRRMIGPPPTCRVFPMRTVPVDPSIDPQFMKPVPDDETRYTIREVLPPSPCR